MATSATHHRALILVLGLALLGNRFDRVAVAGGNECPEEGTCLAPDGTTCAVEVECLVDPCEVAADDECDQLAQCTPNYCGGCHAVCDDGGGGGAEEEESVIIEEEVEVDEGPVAVASSSSTAAAVAVAMDARRTADAAMNPVIVDDVVDPVRHRKFADDLTSNLYSNDNECSSAWGVSAAFSLIYPGCTGDAVDQLRDVFGYPAQSTASSSSRGGGQLAWASTMERMLEDNNNNNNNARGESEGAPLLRVANRVWFDDTGGALDPDYASAVGDLAMQIDFEADDSPAIVNEWVKNSTNGLVESIVDEDRPLYPPSELIAINSIYLRASWKHPFKEARTNLDSFYDSASRGTEASKAHFMNGVFDGLPYSHEALPGYQVVRLPFASSRMSMILVLPTTDGGGGGSVRSGDLLPVLDDLRPSRVALSVPKFKFESTYDDALKSALVRTGIVAPFSGGSLCGLFEDEKHCDSLSVGRIVQKTAMDVHESGLEAAAATAITTGRSAPKTTTLGDRPALVTCDRPFQFFLHDGAEDLVLFEGRVGRPAVPETAPATPLMDARRSDADFWTGAFGVDPVEPPPPADDATVDLADAASGLAEVEPDLVSRGGGVVSFEKHCSVVAGALFGFALGFLF